MATSTPEEWTSGSEYEDGVYWIQADGHDYSIEVPAGAPHRSYGLFGNAGGTITVCGEGPGDALRAGSGEGAAVRDGSGEGAAYRSGSGEGAALRAGSGDGDALRSGSGEGSAYRYGSGDGDALRSGSGEGAAIRAGSGEGDTARHLMDTDTQKMPVVVTTEHRGVFYGRLDEDADQAARTLTLYGCRNAIYWSGSRGFLGLASHGPEDGSKIGATAPEVLLHDITSVSRCTDAAAAVWEGWE